MSAQPKKKLSVAMVDALLHLAMKKTLDSATARIDKKRNRGGWTYRLLGRFLESTFVALYRRGLIDSCCQGHEGRDLVRINAMGEAHLDSRGLGFLLG